MNLTWRVPDFEILDFRAALDTFQIMNGLGWVDHEWYEKHFVIAVNWECCSRAEAERKFKEWFDRGYRRPETHRRGATTDELLRHLTAWRLKQAALTHSQAVNEIKKLNAAQDAVLPAPTTDKFTWSKYCKAAGKHARTVFPLPA